MNLIASTHASDEAARLNGRPDLGSMRAIALFRALQLGDLLCAVPAMRALRRAAPHAVITLVGLPWAQDFASRYAHYIDDFIAFPGFPGLPESTPRIDGLPGFFEQAQARKFDLALQLHGSGALSNPLTVALGARRHAGYVVEGAYCPDPDNFLHWQEREHEVLRNLRLIRHLGADEDDTALEFPLEYADFEALEHTLQRAAVRLGSPGQYACLHAGARLPSRRWPPQHFAQVAHGLMQQGWTVVLTGTQDERSIVDAVLQAMGSIERRQAINLCGQTSLGALAALVAGAGLVVCNDTAMSHIAAAVATPSVVVCCGADPQRWAPLDHQRHRVLLADVPCRPCAHVRCPVGHPCALNVSAEQVLQAACSLSRTAMLARDAVSSSVPDVSHGMTRRLHRIPDQRTSAAPATRRLEP